MKRRKNETKNKKNKGFTLVELIVVLIILAILAAILVPALLGYIDRAREKKELLRAKNFMTMVQAELSELYAVRGDSLTPGTAAANTIFGENDVKAGKDGRCMYSNNGNVNATDTPWTRRVLRQLDLKNNDLVDQKNDPYCVIIGVGSNVNADTGASKHDKFTVYFMFYMEKSDSTPLWYFNGKWSTTKPTNNEINSNTNVIGVGDKKDMKLQYYVLCNKTGKYPAGDNGFMNWYKGLK
ncbi:MAG: prepilin-type N-terminal cleavage/methylation domain-containing protein [Eubacterium sp.]|nr:prepilin-type N-terminal cleavage/methylation domain-containing protein [Eubacterium sp.]